MATSYLPNPIILSNGVIVELGVVPVPKPDTDGRYKSRRDYSVNVGLFRGERLIELRPIGTVICGESEVELADGSRLDEADIEALDPGGWDQLFDLGAVPTELILQIPHQPAAPDMKKGSAMVLFLCSQKGR